MHKVVYYTKKVVTGNWLLLYIDHLSPTQLQEEGFVKDHLHCQMDSLLFFTHSHECTL